MTWAYAARITKIIMDSAEVRTIIHNYYYKNPDYYFDQALEDLIKLGVDDRDACSLLSDGG